MDIDTIALDLVEGWKNKPHVNERQRLASLQCLISSALGERSADKKTEGMQKEINDLTYKVNSLENLIRSLPRSRELDKAKEVVGMRRKTDKKPKGGKNG